MLKPKQFKPNSGEWKSDRRFNGRAAIDNMYDDTWRKYALKFLEINKNCYSCGEKSQVVDHLLPHKGDQKLFEQTDNHLPLCHRCHNTVTALFDRHHKKNSKLNIDKLKWLAANRMRYCVATKVFVLPKYGD